VKLKALLSLSTFFPDSWPTGGAAVFILSSAHCDVSDISVPHLSSTSRGFAIILEISPSDC